jgi:hypothetical protein
MRILLISCLILFGCVNKNINKQIEINKNPESEVVLVDGLKESQKHDIETPVKYFLYIIGAIMLLNLSLIFFKNE